MNNITIAIIGGGNMGACLLSGLITHGYLASNIWIADASAIKRKELEQQFHIQTTADNKEAVKSADIIIFAVKPQILAGVATELATLIQQQKPLILSIAAGIRIASLEKWLGSDIAIVRSMPNTPALIGCGASALYANPVVSKKQRELAQSILRAVGIVVWLEDEKLMDVVTAISGSGPAYFFLLLEILQQAGEQLGLPKEIAHILSLQTGFGAARMALESKKSLPELRKQVTSPGGTTEKALQVLEDKNIRTIFTDAIEAAKNRGAELGSVE
jgi:pyrroline-5-carboxylate reductase